MCPRSSGRCPVWKGPNPFSTGIELQVAAPGLEPELGLPWFVKLGHSLLWDGKGAQGREKVTRDTFLIQDGWAEPSYVRRVIQAAFRSTSQSPLGQKAGKQQ